VARQSNRSKAESLSPDEPAAEVEKTEATAAAGDDVDTDAAAAQPATDAEAGDDGDEAGVDPAEQRAFWEELRIDPVEIALPSGTGFTLRAYRMSNELTPTDTSDREEDDPFSARARQAEEDEEDLFAEEDFGDEEDEDDADDATRDRNRARAADRDGDAEADDEADSDAEAEAEAAFEDDDEDEDEQEPEEVPVFLTHRGKLLLFRSAEGLVSFVRSGAPNDLAQVDTWQSLVEKLQPVNIAPLDEDSYELDLVVENLRGGHDSWDPTLIIEAGEIARDLAYALRLPAVLDMLSPGSSIDDLDEALRGVVDGGIGGFMARRRLRKIGAQTASLGWRTIIGKISAAVDWRD